MKTKSLYDILGLKFQDKFFDVVLCDNQNYQYRQAKEILKNDGTSADCQDSKLTIITSDRNNIYTVLRFIEERHLESLRGATIRKLYIDQEMSNLEKVTKTVQELIAPNVKYIIKID